MKQLTRWLYNELLAGRSMFDWCFLAFGLICQTIVYLVPLLSGEPLSSPIHLVAGITGIISVYLCAQGKISMYIFGLVNIVTYIIISYQQRLFGEVAINGFYFACQAYGIWNWARHYQQHDEQNNSHLIARRLSTTLFMGLIALSVVASVATGYYLGHFTTDSDPYFDAFTTVPAYVAEIMMVMGISQHWYLWFFIDLGCIWMWLRAGNYSMAMLYTFWCLNCLYGFYHWTKSQKPNA